MLAGCALRTKGIPVLRGAVHRGRVLSALSIEWAKHPELRLCQLIVNATQNDPFYVEDDKLVEQVRNYDYEKGEVK